MTLQVVDWAVIVANLCFALFECILIALLLWRAYGAKYVLKPALLVAVIHFIATGLAMNIDTVASLSSNSGIYEYDDDDFGPYLIAESILYGVAYSMIYLFFMLFLHYTLSATDFRPSPWIYGIHSLSLLCLLTLLSLLNVMESDSTMSVNWKRLIFHGANICFALSCTHLVYVFNSKLHSLMLLQRRTIIGGAHGGGTNAESASINAHQSKLIAVITKMSLIGIWILIILLLFLGNGALLTFDVVPGAQHQVEALWQFVTVILVGAWELSMVLVFAMNNDWYFRCCGFCDRKLKRCCEKRAVKEILKKHQETVQLHVRTATPSSAE